MKDKDLQAAELRCDLAGDARIVDEKRDVRRHRRAISKLADAIQYKGGDVLATDPGRFRFLRGLRDGGFGGRGI